MGAAGRGARLRFILAESREALNDKITKDAWPPRFNQFPVTVVGTPDEAIGSYRSLVDAGINYFIVLVRDEETLRLLAREVVPAFE